MATKSTSVEALRKMVKTKTEDQQKVFDELIKHGDKGLTSNEIEKLVKDRRANSRVCELRAAGWIETTSEKRRNRGRRGPGTGGSAFVHIVPLYVRKTGLPIHPKLKKDKVKDTIEVLLVHGVGGFAVYLNGYRIAGEKPWGGAPVTNSWKVDSKDILKAMNAKAK